MVGLWGALRAEHKTHTHWSGGGRKALVWERGGGSYNGPPNDPRVPT